MTSKLSELGYSYRVQKGQLVVPTAHKLEIRSLLARHHLPSHRLLDSDSVPEQQGWSDLTPTQTVLWQRISSEGELVQALREFAEVEDAWVLLEGQSASILLKTHQPVSSTTAPKLLAVVETQTGLQGKDVAIETTEGERLWPK